MSIRWDSLLVRHVARALDERLSGHHLRGIRLDGDARDLILFFREESVVWRLHPTRSALLLRPAVAPAATDLRIRARLRRVDAPPDERILRFEMMGRGKNAGPLELFVELIGNRLNAVITGSGERIIRHVLVRREGDRPLSVGAGYRLPEPTGREGATDGLALERWLAILAPVPPPDRGPELVRRIAWTSPMNRDTFLEPDLEAGHAAWREMVEHEGPADPVILVSERGRQPYPFPLVGYEVEATGSLLDALDACADEEGRAALAASALAMPPALLERLEDAVHRQERRLAGLTAELEQREDPDALRRRGDLILARFSELPAESGMVTLTGFDGLPVEVELDPALPPQKNAARYYDRAARSERAAERIPRLMTRAEERRDALAALLSRALAGEADPQEVREALPTPEREAGTEDRSPSLPYRTFRSSGGLEIRVGRGAKHNDDLTFRHSAPDDIWLHARHSAGAHVILRWRSDENPPGRDLAQAAVLAALHSKARTSTTVPVDWTRRKYVRKPRGSAPGAVTPDRVQTLFVRPDETLLEALSEEG
ncbi:MAG: NFACT RNA binding domain-containing protein [Longimicrobiales bacterium]|nr:NFACT RNA binding domain-containing protein [Longimicrobiales bacterium]